MPIGEVPTSFTENSEKFSVKEVGTSPIGMVLAVENRRRNYESIKSKIRV